MFNSILKEIKRGTMEDVLAKIYTVLIDRRLWISLMTVVGLIFGVPELAENADSTSSEIVDAIVLIVQSVGSLITTFGLLYSWTKRAPSGKNFRVWDQINARYGGDV
jgi:hypothetical protein